MRMLALALFATAATFVVSGGPMVAAPVPKHLMKDAENPDLAAMQGEWELTTMNVDGESMSALEATLEVRGNISRTTIGHLHSSCVFTLDTTNNPRRMISLDSTNPNAKATVAIYKIEGDTLTIADCRDYPEKPPEEFSGEGITALIYTRVRK